jgi:hypothetical protein
VVPPSAGGQVARRHSKGNTTKTSPLAPLYDRTLRLWDAAIGQQIGQAMRHDGTVNGADLTKDGRR